MPYVKNKTENYANIGGINTKHSQYITQQNQVLRLVNMNFRTPGSLTKRDGTSFYLGATTSGKIGGLFEFERLNGASYVIATANTNAYTIQGGSWSSFKSGLLNNGIFSFHTFVDRLFMANGQDFLKYDGSNTSSYSLPKGISTSAFGITAGAGGGLSGIFLAGYGYLNDRGYYGPSCEGVTVSLNGVSYGSIYYANISSPSGYGVTAFVFYRSAAGQVNMYGTTQTPIGVSTFTDTAAITTRPVPQYLHFTLAPQYLELFNNQLFMAGFSSAPSTLYWSDIGEPEGVDPTFFAEIRTNDGDVVRGMRSYQAQLIIAKERSLSRIIGDNPSNFTLQEITDQYGCLSHRTMIVYNNILLFLDSKGIAQFNGANTQIISNEIEDVFKRMNIDAAKNKACAIHNRKDNEVWFAIPVDGSSINNLIVVYDYLTNAWTTYEGINASSLEMIRSTLTLKTPFFGGYTGSVSFFGSTFYNDSGNGITCVIKTRFMQPMGQTTEEQYRRFYLDLDPIVGITQSIGIGFYKNFETSVSATFTMYQSPFQSRIDFGISGKALAAEITHVSASTGLKVNGWTIESRYQRSV